MAKSTHQASTRLKAALASEFRASERLAKVIEPEHHSESSNRDTDAMIASYIKKRYGGHEGGGSDNG